MLYFLGEICTLSLPVDHKKGLFRDLINEGIFDVLTTTLQSEDMEVAFKGADILQQFVGWDRNTVCDYIIGQEGNQLLGYLVKNMITDFGEDVNIVFQQIIEEFLMFPTTQGDAFVDILYKKHLRQLVDLMETSPPSGGVTNPVILSTICTFLVACLDLRPHPIMYDFLRGGLIPKVLSLTRHEDVCLKTSAVVFLDTILKLNVS
uniref:Serine/threonine-protein phosphatase 4 regulatory subunit 3-like central domain-containing protein n=1 Tax=Kalanchoe fedtschenkoi TaxID=63787 RepID=A0A7N0VGF3_KALFE